MGKRASGNPGLTEEGILIGKLIIIIKRAANKHTSTIPQNEATDSKGLYHFKTV